MEPHHETTTNNPTTPQAEERDHPWFYRRRHPHHPGSQDAEGGGRHKKNPKRATTKLVHVVHAVQEEWNSLSDFFQPSGQTVKDQLLFLSWALVIPSLIVSGILFYLVGNPPVRTTTRNAKRTMEMSHCVAYNSFLLIVVVACFPVSDVAVWFLQPPVQ